MNTSKLFVLCIFCAIPICVPFNFKLRLATPIVPYVEPTVLKFIKNEKFTIKQTQNERTETLSLLMCVSVQAKEANKFDTRFAVCQNEIIAKVEEMLQATTFAERIEPDSTTIKKRAKTVINQVLGVDYVVEVLVSEVNYEVN